MGAVASSSAEKGMRRAFPAAASSASRRAFPAGAPVPGGSGREEQEQQQGPARTLPKHLQAVVAEKAGELDGRSLARVDVGDGALSPSSLPTRSANMNADTSLAEAGMVQTHRCWTVEGILLALPRVALLLPLVSYV